MEAQRLSSGMMLVAREVLKRTGCADRGCRLELRSWCWPDEAIEVLHVQPTGAERHLVSADHLRDEGSGSVRDELVQFVLLHHAARGQAEGRSPLGEGSERPS